MFKDTFDKISLIAFY